MKIKNISVLTLLVNENWKGYASKEFYPMGIKISPLPQTKTDKMRNCWNSVSLEVEVEIKISSFASLPFGSLKKYT